MTKTSIILFLAMLAAACCGCGPDNVRVYAIAGMDRTPPEPREQPKPPAAEPPPPPKASPDQSAIAPVNVVIVERHYHHAPERAVPTHQHPECKF